MDRFVALYRGINITGRNLVRMEVLRALHEGLGHRSVVTYIQSGNVLFSARGTAPRLARAIADRFANQLGFSPRVMVVPAERWAAIVRANPFAEFSAKDHKRVHACVCEGEPSEAGLSALLKRTGGTERFCVKEGVIYLHTPDGFGASKFAGAMEKACGVPITARNWRTVETLLRMIEDGGAREEPVRAKRGAAGRARA